MTKSRKIEIALQLTLIIIGIIAIRYLSLTGFATFEIQPQTVMIDGNLNDWTPVLSSPANVVYDGPWNNLTDLDAPKYTYRNLVRAAATQDNSYLYFYFERVSGHASTDLIVYLDANNNGLMETGEPVIDFSWTKYGTYGTDCSSCAEDYQTNFELSAAQIDCGSTRSYWLSYFTYIAKNSGGDNITSCGDGCKMPGKSRLVKRNIEQLAGSNSNYTALETRFSKNIANITSGNFKFHISSAKGQNVPEEIVDNMNPHSIFYDVTLPSINNVQPVAGSQLTQNVTTTISAAVTDNINVSSVWAAITLPNSTVQQINLLNSGGTYSLNFTNTNLFGIYNVTIFANDTSNNLNTATTWFNVTEGISIKENATDPYGNPYNVTILITNPYTGELVYNSTQPDHNAIVPPGTYDVTLIPPANYSSILNITFHFVNITTSIDQIVDLGNILDIRYLDPSVIYNNVFAANLILTAPYLYATIYGIANGENLYKCRVFDYVDQICYGQWIKIRSGLVPGQVFAINLSKGDPAFGEGTDKLVLTTITVDGNINDWAAVLDNSNNVIIDGVSGIDDPDNPDTVSRDLTKFAFTWDSNNFYTYFRRVYGTPSAVSLLAYLDYGQDGYMNSSDKVLRIAWLGGSKKYSVYLHNYVPSNVSGDILTGDGVDMPGSLSNQTTLATDVYGIASNNIELEANVSWANLGLAAGAPFKFHISLAKGDTTNVPTEVRDNLAQGSILIADVLITPDNTGGTNANTSVYYNHTVKNLGNYNDTFNINLSSSKGFTIQALWPNRTALTDTNGDSVVDIGKLGPGQNTSMTVKVTVPAGTAAGTKDITRVSAISARNSNISSIAYDTTFVGDITITPAYFGRIANNTILTYNHTVANNLGVNVVIDMNATSNQGWAVQLTWPNGTALTDTNANGKIDVGNVSSGSSKNFSLKLTVPSAAAAETMDTTTITANSSVNASNSGFVTDRTTVAPRIEVSPDHTGEAGIGDYVFYEHEVFNNWNSSDTVNIAYSSNKSWLGALYKSDKTTLLNDTNSDGKPDTGTLAYAGGSAKIVAKVSVPISAVEGDMDVARVNGTSSLNSSIFGVATDNTTARILVIYNDSARTQQDYYFRLNEIVYAKAFGLNSIAEVYFVWVDSNDTIKRTSPDITVDTSKQALDNFTTNSSMPDGNWTLILYKSSNHQEITRRDFFVAEITPPSVTNVLPSAGTAYNQSSIVTIRANVTDNVAVDTVLASITLPNSTVGQIILSNIANSSGYIGNFTNTNLTGRYNITIIANDTSGNVNNTEKTWFNITFSADTTPPASVTGLANISATLTSIYWNWTNPTDLDFNSTIIYLNGNNVANTSNNYYNATGLNCSTQYTLTVYTKDNAGNVNATNVSKTATTAACIDTTPPQFNNSSTRPVAGSQYNQTQTVPFVIGVNENSTVTANISWDSTSQLVNLTYNGTNWYYTYNFTNTTFPGNYNITFNATDTSGNSNITTSNFTIKDIIAPTISNIQPAAGANYNQSQSVNITANVTDQYYDSVGTVIAQVRYPNGTLVNYTLVEIGNTQIFNSLLFNNTQQTGTYNVTIFANDTSGNSNTGTTYFVINDVTPPSITNITTNPTLPIVNNGSSQNITTNFTSSEYPVNITFKLYYPNGTIAVTQGPTQVNNASGLPINFTIPAGLSPDGNYTLNMTVKDSVNNTNTTTLGIIVVDTTPPQFNSSVTRPVAGSQYNQTQTIPFVVGVNENSTVTANVSWDSTSQVVNLAYNGTNWYYNNTFANTTYVGVYTIVFNATDIYGHSNTTTSNFTIVDVTAPNISNIQPTAGTNRNQSQSANITANVTDYYYDSVGTVIAQITYPNGTKVNYTLTEIDNTQIFDNLLFNDTSTLGRYNITIFANDTSGNANTGASWFNVTTSCTSNITNTSWSAWTNLSCVGSQMNQSKFLTQYDANNCGPANQTFYEYQLVGPTYANTTWSGWYNITGCLPGDYYTQERNLTQYDIYACAANTTFYGYQNLTCDYCTPNSTNTTWSSWSNVSCSGNQMNQSRYLTQYDSNNCNETTNQTFFEYQLVGPTYQNTSWTSWYNITACLFGDYYTQERNLTQFDTYGCAANQTFFGYQNQTCDFCTPNLTNTTWSLWMNLTCVGNNMNQSQNRTQYDSNNCNETTNQTFYNYQLAGPDWVNGSWSSWYNITACLYGDYYTQSRNMTQTDTYGCAVNQTLFEYQNQTCDFCTPSLANTSWSAWSNVSCIGNQMNQSRFRTQYDINNCNETTNQTFYEYLLVGPTYANTSWSSWYNITACQPGDYYTQEKNLTQYDVYGCAANTTFFEHQNQSCVYCASNLINTTWSSWANLTCIGSQMNQSRNLTQYDTNNCTSNQTFFEYQLVGPNLVNGSWSSWYNITACLLGDYYTQERNLTQHDTYGCAANQTLFGYQNLTCDYCTPNLTNTTWTGWYNTSVCYANNTIDRARNKTQYDTNNCNETTNQTFFEYGTAACDYDGAPRIEIISPINSTYTTSLLLVNISVNDSAISRIWYNWNGTNVTYTTPVNVTFGEGSNTLIVYANDTLGNLNVTSVSFTVDTTPPHTITNLQSPSQSVTWIYWTWTNPIDADFYQNIIYLDGVNIANTSNNYYNATGLTQNSTYTITVNTKDTHGNVNATNVSNANKTLVDNTPPVISNVTVQSIAHNSAQVIWDTDELANSTIEYGTTLAFGSNASNASFVLSHAIPLAGLSASTMYFFNVTSCDQYNYCITDGPYNFTTSATPIIPPGPGPGGGGGGGMGGGDITNATNTTTATTNATPGTSLGSGRYYIGNFLYASIYNYTQSPNEVWVFTYELVDHTVTLLRINDGQSVDLMVNSTPVYFNLLVGRNRVIDVDGDGVGDVRVTLNAITAGRANIAVELLNKPAGAGSARFSLQSWWIFLVTLFLIWAVWRKKKRDEERKKEAAEKREAKGKRAARRKHR